MDLESIASAAGTSVVTALTSRVAGDVIGKVAAVFKQHKTAAELRGELKKSQDAITANPENQGGEAYIWKGKFFALLQESPEALAEVQTLIEGLAHITTDERISITQTMIGSQNAVQVGGDMVIPGESRRDRKRRR